PGLQARVGYGVKLRQLDGNAVAALVRETDAAPGVDRAEAVRDAADQRVVQFVVEMRGPAVLFQDAYLARVAGRIAHHDLRSRQPLRYTYRQDLDDERRCRGPGCRRVRRSQRVEARRQAGAGAGGQREQQGGPEMAERGHGWSSCLPRRMASGWRSR